MKKGFTLVELSIVLVIIGLLVGGILVGQNLINSVNMSRTISDLAKFDAIAMTYKEQYRYLPGDNPNEPAADTLSWGCSNSFAGDGMIDAGCYLNLRMGADYFGGIRQFWYIISNRTFPAGTTPNASRYITSGPTQNAYPSPIAKGTNAGYYISCRATFGGQARLCDANNISNYYAIVSLSPAGNTIWPMDEGVVTTSNAFSLDKKIDDGIPDAGNVRSGSATPARGVTIIEMPSSSTDACSTSGAYNVGTDDRVCIPVIRLGAQTGMLY